MNKLNLLAAAGTVVFAASAQAADPEPYGSIALSGIYSSQDNDFSTEEINGSALVPRITAGLRWEHEGGGATRLQATSAFWHYFQRKDRWYNSIHADHLVPLGDKVQLSLDATGSINLATLESRSADQASVGARFIFRPEKTDTISLGGAVRRRWYDNSSAKSWSPIVEADYRHRFGRNQFLDLEASHEWTNADNDFYDYRRTYVAGFYTHPLGRDTRLRGGLSYRRWNWDARFDQDGDERRDRLWLPQVQLQHDLNDQFELSLDYRRIIRRSSDDRLDRKGNYLAGTIRYRLFR